MILFASDHEESSDLIFWCNSSSVSPWYFSKYCNSTCTFAMVEEISVTLISVTVILVSHTVKPPSLNFVMWANVLPMFMFASVAPFPAPLAISTRIDERE